MFDPDLATGEGLYEFGMVLPESALMTNTYDYIGLLVCWFPRRLSLVFEPNPLSDVQ